MYHNIPDALFDTVVKAYAFAVGKVILHTEDMKTALFNYSFYSAKYN